MVQAHIKPLEDLCGDPDYVRLMKTWLLQCTSSHKLCAKRESSLLPSRLLDLEAFGVDAEFDVNLVTTDHLQNIVPHPDYIRLSRCWGPPENRPIVTQKSNFLERLTRITFNNLPKTFQDAVRIARQ